MGRVSTRSLRVASEVHQVLDELLRTEVRDPRLERVRINAVEVSGDLGVAKAYFGTLDPDVDPSAAEEALRRAAGFLRARVGQHLQLRRVPELRFEYDQSARHGIALTHLIEEAAATSLERNDADDE
jgi:ribosome-binding factor A